LLFEFRSWQTYFSDISISGFGGHIAISGYLSVGLSLGISNASIKLGVVENCAFATRIIQEHVL